MYILVLFLFGCTGTELSSSYEDECVNDYALDGCHKSCDGRYYMVISGPDLDKWVLMSNTLEECENK
jgi:hypothetical protein